MKTPTHRAGGSGQSSAPDAGRRSAVADGSSRKPRRPVSRQRVEIKSTPGQLAQQLLIEAQDKIARAISLKPGACITACLRRANHVLCTEVQNVTNLLP